MNRQVYVVDFKDEARAAGYETWRRAGCVPPQMIAGIRAAGVDKMEICRFSNWLVLISHEQPCMCAGDQFSSDASRASETRMDECQQGLSGATNVVKWQKAFQIFDLDDHLDKDNRR